MKRRKKMYYRLMNRLDYESLQEDMREDNPLKKVSDRIEEIIDTLDDNYGAQRNSKAMGGYLLLFQSEENYEELKMQILSFYQLDINDYEYSETLIEDKEYNVEWWEELYMLSSDDAIVIMHPRSKED